MIQDILDCWNQAAELQSDRTRLIVWLECLRADKDYEKIDRFFSVLIQTKELIPEEKLGFYWQIFGILFTCTDVPMNISAQRLSLWKHISDCYQTYFSDLKPVNNRYNDVVLVTVQQFLNLTHGPTKTVLDRAYVLSKMGKKVFIVNTAELYGGYMAGMNHPMKASYIESLSQYEQLEYRGVVFPFLQFEPNMPNVEGTQLFLDYISELKPMYIVNIGSESLTLDCAARRIPVLNINLVSSIVASLPTRQVIGRELREEDDALIAKLGLVKEEILVGKFTFSINKQEKKYTRKELHIPEGRFVIAVIGGRLTQELDLDFIKMLEPALKTGAFLVIIGKMDTYNEMCIKSSVFHENSIHLGMQSDVLAIFECCDLYVNPKRIGGGTSVIEAMYKGLPAVTLNYGDVAVSAGSEFCVSNYEEMGCTVLKYMTNQRFYEQMSEKAKKRAEFMLDSEQAFAEIIYEFERIITE